MCNPDRTYQFDSDFFDISGSSRLEYEYAIDDRVLCVYTKRQRDWLGKWHINVGPLTRVGPSAGLEGFRKNRGWMLSSK